MKITKYYCGLCKGEQDGMFLGKVEIEEVRLGTSNVTHASINEDDICKTCRAKIIDFMMSLGKPLEE